MDILVLGPDGQEAAILEKRLASAGHDFRKVGTSEEMLTMLGLAHHDALIVLHDSTAGISGPSSASLVRLAGLDTPVIVVATADLSEQLSELKDVIFVRIRNLRYNDVIAALERIRRD